MTINELLKAPLMRGTKIIAGQNGLDNEVTWVAPDTEIDFNQWVMPGLLLLHTPAHEKKPWPETAIKMNKAKPAGIVLFSNTLTPLMKTIIETRDFSYYTENKLPLLLLPRGVNMLSFSKHFISVMATQFLLEYRRDEWLRELTYSGFSPGNASSAEAYGYLPESDYFCLLLTGAAPSDDRHIQTDMNMNSMRNFLSQEFSLQHGSVLSFADSPALTSFIPKPQESDYRSFRNNIINSMHKLRQAFPRSGWTIVVGTSASSLSEFSVSYRNALKTADIVAALGIREDVSFYDDWYMHMLLLKDSDAELSIQMQRILAPVLSDSELMETLSCYLASGENLKLTSEKLYIHVNTLKYRLQRISGLLNCNLKDPNIRFRLRMALVIVQYLQNRT